MVRPPPVDLHDAVDPPTDAEARRVGALLATVDSRTLLNTLATLCPRSEDANLIIAALLGRLPLENGGTPG